MKIKETEPSFLLQRLKQCYNVFKKKLNVMDDNQYPRFQKVNVIFDRRLKGDKEYTLIFCQPPDNCNTIPHGTVPSEVYLDLTRRYLIPISGTMDGSL